MLHAIAVAIAQADRTCGRDEGDACKLKRRRQTLKGHIFERGPNIVACVAEGPVIEPCPLHIADRLVAVLHLQQASIGTRVRAVPETLL
jgi:hypothetical protein